MLLINGVRFASLLKSLAPPLMRSKSRNLWILFYFLPHQQVECEMALQFLAIIFITNLFENIQVQIFGNETDR